MDVWIGTEDRGHVREVRVEGRLAGAAIGVFEKVLGGLEPPIRIDMRRLLSADDAGLEALRATRELGAELVGARPLMAYLLNGGPVK